jgi:hypothetical protein
MPITIKSLFLGIFLFSFPGLVCAQSAPLDDLDVKALRKERKEYYLQQFTCATDELLCGKESKLLQNVLVLGDSHAVDAFNTMFTAFPEYNFLLSRISGCAPYSEDQRDKKCADDNAARWEKIDALKNIQAVVLKIRLTEDRAESFIKFIPELKAKFPKLIVFGAGPFYKRELPEVYERFEGEGIDEFRDESPYNTNAAVRAAVETAGGVFIDQHSFFCPNDICADVTRDGSTLIVVDEHHQTLQAARELGIFIREQIPDLFVSN